MWFRWEKNFGGKWNPTVYHQERPKVPSGDDPAWYTAPQEIPPECIGNDGEPMFGALQKRFPAPKVVQT